VEERDREWVFEPSSELELSMLERLHRYPREPDMTVFLLRSAAALALRAWLKVYHRLRIRGREHLPREGSFILVANHASHLDVLCLLSALPLGRLHAAFPAAAADYFFENVTRGALSVLFFNAIPFRRREGASQSLLLCRGLLGNPGNVLVLFPEGTRSPTGTMGPFKSGIGILAGGTSLPVVPCFLRGAHEALPRGSSWPRPVPLELRLGPPRAYPGAPPTPEGAMEVARDLEEAVRALGA
jgi:1-acyl-sn-glycerol-3-phosphate acyltransferase